MGAPGCWLLAETHGSSSPCSVLCEISPHSIVYPERLATVTPKRVQHRPPKKWRPLKLHLELDYCVIPTTFSRSEQVHSQPGI